jgi:1-aminocyclopropane-1-carboxylate deaminase
MFDIAQEFLLPSPIQILDLSKIGVTDCQILIKRDDLIHPYVSGNKYRKLKYNFAHIVAHNIETVITFGGAFSNHLYATAAMAYSLGIRSVGIVRGEIDPNNPTLQFCKKNGMHLIPVARSDYRSKEKSPEIQKIIHQFKNYMIIPVGGTNTLAIKGVAEIWDEIASQLSTTPDYLVLSVGTGGTAAGLLSKIKNPTKIICFPALKNVDLRPEVERWLPDAKSDQLIVQQDYAFGGYGKTNAILMDFIATFEATFGILLDPVYNAKAMYGLVDFLTQNKIPRQSNILYIHTGGQQGIDGWRYMHAK